MSRAYTLIVYRAAESEDMVIENLSLDEALDLIEEHNDGQNLFDLQVENLGN